MGRLIFFLATLMFAGLAQATENDHRRVMVNVAVFSAETEKMLGYPFFSTVSISREKNVFKSSAGFSLFSVKDIVYSDYDETVAYDVSDLYRPARQRYNFRINWGVPVIDGYLSVGLDTGTKTSKLEIPTSRFIGFTKGIKIGTRSVVVFGAGQWFHAGIIERPCLDSYDREYWCPNLTAWKDKAITDYRNEKYFDIKYIKAF